MGLSVPSVVQFISVSSRQGIKINGADESELEVTTLYCMFDTLSLPTGGKLCNNVVGL